MISPTDGATGFSSAMPFSSFKWTELYLRVCDVSAPRIMGIIPNPMQGPRSFVANWRTTSMVKMDRWHFLIFSSPFKNIKINTFYSPAYYKCDAGEFIDFNECESGDERCVVILAILTLSSLCLKEEIQKRLLNIPEGLQGHVKVILEHVFDCQDQIDGFHPDFNKILSEVSTPGKF